MKKHLRQTIFVFIFTLMIFSLIAGIGIVDNCNKLALGNPFLNTIYFDSDNYILCFRYFGLNFSFSFNFFNKINNVFNDAKPLIISILVIFEKLKSLILNLF